MSDQNFIYQLKPVRETEPGWWKLRWRPIRNGTCNLWASTTCPRYRRIGAVASMDGAHNGWGRSWDSFALDLSFWWFEIEFWIRWNIVVMANGPLDMPERRPLDLSGVRP